MGWSKKKSNSGNLSKPAEGQSNITINGVVKRSAPSTTAPSMTAPSTPTITTHATTQYKPAPSNSIKAIPHTPASPTSPTSPTSQQTTADSNMKYRYTMNGRTYTMTRSEVWNNIATHISQYAPSFTPFTSLTPQALESKQPRVFCNGKQLYISDKFWTQPYYNMLYQVVFEFTQVILGHRREKDIKIKTTIDMVQDTLKRKLALKQIMLVEDIICHSILLQQPETIGVNKKLINPTTQMLNSIKRSFGDYIPEGYSREKEGPYALKPEMTQKFLDNWSVEVTSDHYEEIIKNHKKFFEDQMSNKASKRKQGLDYVLYPKSKRKYYNSSTPFHISISKNDIERMKNKIKEDMQKEKNELLEKTLQQSTKENIERQERERQEYEKQQSATTQQQSEPDDSTKQESSTPDDSQQQQSTPDSNPQPNPTENQDTPDSDSDFDDQDISDNDSILNALSFGSSNNTDDISDAGGYREDGDYEDDGYGGADYEDDANYQNQFNNDDIYNEQDFEDQYTSQASSNSNQQQPNQQQQSSSSGQQQQSSSSNQQQQSSTSSQQQQSSSSSQQQASQHQQSSQSNQQLSAQQKSFNTDNITQDDISNFMNSLSKDVVLDIYDKLNGEDMDVDTFKDLIEKAINDDENMSDEIKEAVNEALESSDLQYNISEEKEREYDEEGNEIIEGDSEFDIYDTDDISEVTEFPGKLLDKGEYQDVMIDVNRFRQQFGPAAGDGESCERLDRIVSDIYRVSNVWWKKVQKMIMGYVPDVNSSFRRPNKKYAMSEFILPSRCDASEESQVDRLRVYLDSSGSMSQEDFMIFKSIIKSSQKYFPKETYAYEFNTSVFEMKCVGGKILGEPKSTGGTSIQCVLRNIKESNLNKMKTLNIVVTDGGFNWRTLVDYMKNTDRQSKFVFILTRGKISESESTRKQLSPKRLNIIYIEGADNNLKALKWG